MSETLQQFVLSLPIDGRPALRRRTEFRSFTWTYGDLALRVRTIAHWFGSQGLTQGDRVLFWAPNSPTWAVAFLACFATGLVPVPLDLHSTPDFVELVADETEARLMLRGRFQPHVSRAPRSMLDDELEWETRPGQPALATWPTVKPDDLAEILYTSGTTAQPKGVMLTHRNLCANLDQIQPVVPVERYYRLVSLLPLSHSFEQTVGLLLPLGRGGRITYLETLKPSALTETLQEERPNVIVVVPALLELLRSRVESRLPALVRRGLHAAIPLLLTAPLATRRALGGPLLSRLDADLKYFVVGGAPLDQSLERFWDALGVLVLQGYGLTEASPVVTANTPRAHRIGSVGRPLPCVQVRLGADGEILVKGPNVTPGYYHRPAATRDAFVDGWLRTGDLGEIDRDGFLYVRGRAKDVIVTPAGLKVYPEDVERALNAEPGVRDSAVLEWQGQVFAVLLLDPTRAAAPSEIVERANRRLNPVQQIHGWLVWPWADFPRTPTLKIRKFKIREALAANVPARTPLARPAGRLEQLVQNVAPDRPVTPRARLGPDLDLSSIDRLELITLLEEEFHVDIAETDVTSDTTVADLARLVETSHRKRRPQPPKWPLNPLIARFRSFAQRKLIFPVLRHAVWIAVQGEENLSTLTGPGIFAANHVSHLDAPSILMSLPRHIRERTAVAALAGFYYPPSPSALVNAWHWALFDLAALFFNVFPVPRERGFRESLRFAGFLVEHGWNILIFPEGSRSWTGELTPFREGIGLLATELKVPVVPVRVRGTYRVLRRSAVLPRPGPVTVRFGHPMYVPPISYWEATRQIEKAVAEL